MTIFSLSGYENEKIVLEFRKELGFPNSTSYEGGYAIECFLQINVGGYHIKSAIHYSATGALYRFSRELKRCYDTLQGEAEYQLKLENDLMIKVSMLSSGHAVITGSFQARPDKQNILQFEIATDQTYLLSVIQDIESLKGKYGDI